MFTGIVQAVGRVERVGSGSLRIAAPEGFGEPIALGESVAVDGCCLTVARAGTLDFDLSAETLRRTNLGSLREGSRVNLERAMRASDRFGGHFVQGHVDARAELVAIASEGRGAVIRVRAPAEGARYLIDKGSATLDGVSLTVVEPRGGEFDVWLVPHTLAVTTLGSKAVGDALNLEYDVLAKVTEGLLKGSPEAPL